MQDDPLNQQPLFESSRARDWREGRRLRALELRSEGYRVTEIARVLGVTPGAVSQWMKRANLDGPAALLRRQRRGRPRRLSPEQNEELMRLLREPGQHWTGKRVTLLIMEKWGVPFSAAHASRLLRFARNYGG